MLIVSRRIRATAHGIARFLPHLALALLAAPLAAHAQDTTAGKPPLTPLQKQLDKLELGIAGFGSITKSTAGPITVTTAPNAGQNLTLKPSTTVGYDVNLRYTAKPWVGFELNYVYARYSENFSYVAGAVQSNATEYTLGYVAHPPHVFAGFIHPFIAVGAGSTAFRPTTGGGQGLLEQARATYYYGLGVDAPVNEHFGLRLQFRQAFFLAPDFGQNYLTNLQHSYTVEPGAGFYLRY